MELQRLSIRQTFGKIGIETENAQQTLESPRGELSIETKRAVVEGNYEPGELTIDSSAAWSALGKGSHMQWMNMIYSQMDQIALQAIAKQVEDGHRMGMITNKKNAFADIGKKASQETLGPIQYVGEASNMNVKLNYEPRPYQAEVQPAELHINYTPQKVQAQYQAGKVNINLEQPFTINIRVSDYSWDWDS
ncbi:DUF6470 family protein [Paenibacillus guangzhouensis]|uniref:DUF6470 family protein n=1 Tax=Paenibacillus guangzhouensis TaxID=1473112 RepID=UPI00126714F5|nr:DUF6470 family protein [Paenibacillus guangzhouensis]